ncbi:MAG: T9SS type A sorting domain-containing protein [Flavobacteriales bacterium]|nr:T9SS type A sorting domain-containing protein [Flavobacteriales bacterium]NCP90969.1 T9SS type A sorting domain-containing protein [Flavobacteriales bacterium]PIQ17983.1 MAG: hypothetical protein COW66_08855 [Flavobacteriaceae bacterium CG18_big_fil_WC_8_21_14_2_50_34_36]
MKKYIILLILVFGFTKTNAQDPQLFENTWYLQNVIIDGNSNIPPSNDEVPFVTVAFDVPGFETAVCDVLSSDINFIGSNEFTMFNAGTTFDDCQNSMNTDFEIIYLDDFYINHINDLFSYDIIDETNGSKTLTVTNISGNQAIYNTMLLSNPEFKVDTFSVFPNPASKEIFIHSRVDLKIDAIQVVDVNGKLIFSDNQLKTSKTSIKIENLKTGLYIRKCP